MLKTIKTDSYEILFNTRTGLEITNGINGNSDPFSLEYPSLMDIGIKGNCSNNDCVFCYQGKEQRPDMPLDNYMSIVDQSKKFVNQIALGGKGNPNSHKHFKEIIEYTVKNKIVPNYTTSGHDLTMEQVEVSKKCGAVAVSISNLHDYTFQAIKMLMDAGIKTNLHWVLSKKSIEDVIQMLGGHDIWNGKIDLSKLNSIILLTFKNQGRGKNLEGWSLDPDDIKRILPCLRNQKNSFKIGADSCFFCKLGQFDKFTPMEELFADTCEASRFSVYVSCDMKMMPCSFGNREEYGIDITTTPIKEVWKYSEIFIETRNKLKKNPFYCPYGL